MVETQDERTEATAVFDDAVVELLAQRVHEMYVRVQSGAGRTQANLAAIAAWADLEEQYKEQNRGQVRDIPRKLGLLGWQVVRGGRPLTLTIENKRQIARAEHDRWRTLKRKQGYTLGDRRDDQLMTHPDLVSWDELTEVAKSKDLDAIELIPDLLTLAGCGVAPAQGGTR